MEKFYKTLGWIYKEQYCKGCFNTNKKPPLWANYHIRSCALINDVQNCGYCLDFPCPRIKNMIQATETIAKRTKDTGTQDEYQKFALPYSNKLRLEQINQEFRKTISEISYRSVNIHTMNFQAELNLEPLLDIGLNREEIEKTLQNLHSTLKSINTLHCYTKGGQEQELKRKKDKIKFFWTVGMNGKIMCDNDRILIQITLKELKDQIKYGKYRIKRKLKELENHRIKTEFVDNKINSY
ncbi:MAG: DUF3795 domain-containing protein [Candidatus Hodarchaeota archaeon]